jgi:hypothetical protein
VEYIDVHLICLVMGVSTCIPLILVCVHLIFNKIVWREELTKHGASNDHETAIWPKELSNWLSQNNLL